MKRFPLAACLAVLLAWACNGNSPVDEQEPVVTDEPEVKETPQPGVYNFVLADDCTGKTAWQEGDMIYIHGGYTPSAVTVTVSASDISEDGRTASINLSTVPDTVYPPDGFYAAYPASSVSEDSNFCDSDFTFIQDGGFFACAWLSGTTFEFHGLCGTLSFSVDGDWTDCVFAGPSWELVRYDSFYVSVNSGSQAWGSNRGAAHYYFNAKVQDGKVSFNFPGGIEMNDGFRIYFGKNGTWSKVYSRDGSMKLERGGLLALGDISASLEDYDGPAPEDPKMPEIGKYERFTTSLTEISGICFTADKSAIWGVGDEGGLAQISFDGKTTIMWKNGNDLEDVTIHPVTGDLYVAVEGSQKVCRIKAPDYANSMETVFKIQEAIDGKYGNSGLEGIAYYKDDMLFVGSQVAANVWLCTLDGEIIKKVSLRKLNPAVQEVGGLCYDPVTDWLWVTDSEAHKLFVFDSELTHLLAAYPVPYISNNESVLVDHEHECVWVGDDEDTPRVYKIAFTGLNDY